RMADRQRAAVGLPVVAGRGGRPVIAVLAHPAVVVGPAERIGRAFEPGDLQHQLAPRRPADTEMEPLTEFRQVILADRQSGFGAADGQHLDVAAVEIAVDPDVVHSLTLTSIVSPLLPGKPRNSASAIAEALALVSA